MKLTARFPCLTPAWSEVGTVDFVEVVVADIRMVLEVTLPSRRSVPGLPTMVVDRAIELVMADGTRSPALFASADEVSGWMRADREGRCPKCHAHNAHSNLACNDVLTPSLGWRFP